MTLLIAIRTIDAAILISDMRLSYNGIVCSDETVKSTFLEASDARLIFAYTGIAEWKPYSGQIFNTQDWLVKNVHICLQQYRNIEDTLNALRTRISYAFNNERSLLGSTRKDRKLTILFTGFAYKVIARQLKYCSIIATLSNFQDYKNKTFYPDAQSDFLLEISIIPPNESTGAIMAGAVSAVNSQEKEKLDQLIFLKKTKILSSIKLLKSLKIHLLILFQIIL